MELYRMKVYTETYRNSSRYEKKKNQDRMIGSAVRGDYMKIAMVGHKMVPSRLGGIEIHVEELACRLADMGHEVHLYNRGIYTPDATDKSLSENLHMHDVFTVRKSSLEALVYSFLASLQVMAGGYDIVHYHALGPTVMSILPRLARRKLVCTVHGLDWQRAKWKGLATSYLKLGEYASARFTHKTISVSRPLVGYYKDKYNKDIDYIPNGIGITERLPLGELKERLGIRDDGYFLFVARIVPEKGCHYLIDAFRKLETDKKLIIAGDNPYDPKYIDSLKKAAEGDERIRFIGFQDKDILTRLYSNAFSYILPSDIEGLPISLLEAMSFGCRCIVSDIDENAAVIGDYGKSFRKSDVQSLSDAMKDMLDRYEPQELDNEISDDGLMKSSYDMQDNYSAERQRIIDHIRSTYDWDAVTAQTLDVYEKLYNGKG